MTQCSGVARLNRARCGDLPVANGTPRLTGSGHWLVTGLPLDSLACLSSGCLPAGEQDRLSLPGRGCPYLYLAPFPSREYRMSSGSDVHVYHDNRHRHRHRHRHRRSSFVVCRLSFVVCRSSCPPPATRRLAQCQIVIGRRHAGYRILIPAHPPRARPSIRVSPLRSRSVSWTQLSSILNTI